MCFWFARVKRVRSDHILEKSDLRNCSLSEARKEPEESRRTNKLPKTEDIWMKTSWQRREETQVLVILAPSR